MINPQQLDVTLFASEDVPLDEAGLRQLLEVLTLEDTVRALRARADFFGADDGAEHAPGLTRVVLTPDLHRGSGIPVGTVAQTRGFVLPQAVGSDICCGMRLTALDLTRQQLEPRLDQLGRRLRELFFEGKRDLALSPRQREAMLREGLWGLYEARQDNQGRGLWRLYDPERELRAMERVHFEGGLSASGVFAFQGYIQASGRQDARDAQLGSVGGGNHFVELQAVEEILDGATAHAWGVRPDAVMIMAHSGSVGLGHTVGDHFAQLARSLYPRGMAHPEHGFYPLPTRGPLAHHAQAYLDAMRNAANFAFANRMFLVMMVVQALQDVLGRPIEHQLIYDAPHNLIWSDLAHDLHLHRKGACPAYGPDALAPGPAQHLGQPVIVPGSMGDSSYLMAGLGHHGALCSACHGAGRAMTRRAARHIDPTSYREQVQPLRVIGPLDPDAAPLRLRPDLLQRHHERLAEEGPYAYKPIAPVVQTIEDAQIARRVARHWPLMTIKG